MGRREENKQKKRERLLSEGLAAFLSNGYDGASIETIATASDVARGTFYLYFDSKLALFEALVDEWFTPLHLVVEQTHAAVEAAPDAFAGFAAYMSMAEQITNITLHHRDTVLMTFREVRAATEAGLSLRQRELRLQEATVRLTETAAQRGIVQVDDARLATLLILGAVEKLHYEWLVGADLGDPTSLPPRVMGLFARTLGLPAL